MYRVYWISPRGFANEGFYLFGSIDETDRVAAPYFDNPNSVVTLIAETRNETAARNIARNAAKEDGCEAKDAATI